MHVKVLMTRKWRNNIYVDKSGIKMVYIQNFQWRFKNTKLHVIA